MKTTPAKKFRNPRAKNNFTSRSCSIAAVGSYVPERILTNADLEKMVALAFAFSFIRADDAITRAPKFRAPMPRRSTSSL